MKCTLRKVSQGVVATIDERPKKGGWYYNKYNRIIYNANIKKISYNDKNFHIIIASTFGIGKEFKWERGGVIQDVNNFHDRFIEQVKDKQYAYTETDTQIIIQL